LAFRLRRCLFSFQSVDFMNLSRARAAFRLSGVASAVFASLSVFAQTPSVATSVDIPVKSLGAVTINSGRPSSLPTQIPTTIEVHHRRSN
jgi:iron complex outermembrane receptor protein